MAKLSAVIITLNEERHIARCLQSLQGVADDVVVMDSISTDRTAEIAKEMGARVYSEKWLGYAAMKNKGNQLAQYDLILSIDADEELSPELAASINAIKENPQGAYYFNLLNNYYGKFLKHGGQYPHRKKRIFDRRTARWTGGLHEALEFDNGVQLHFLQGHLLHYTTATPQEHWNKIQRYSRIAAEEMKRKGRHPSWFKKHVGSAFKFVNTYVFKLGFLDGKEGHMAAYYSAKAVALREDVLASLWKADKP